MSTRLRLEVVGETLGVHGLDVGHRDEAVGPLAVVVDAERGVLGGGDAVEHAVVVLRPRDHRPALEGLAPRHGAVLDRGPVGELHHQSPARDVHGRGALDEDLELILARDLDRELAVLAVDRGDHARLAADGDLEGRVRVAGPLADLLDVDGRHRQHLAAARVVHGDRPEEADAVALAREGGVDVDDPAEPPTRLAVDLLAVAVVDAEVLGRVPLLAGRAPVDVPVAHGRDPELAREGLERFLPAVVHDRRRHRVAEHRGTALGRHQPVDLHPLAAGAAEGEHPGRLHARQHLHPQGRILPAVRAGQQFDARGQVEDLGDPLVLDLRQRSGKGVDHHGRQALLGLH